MRALLLVGASLLLFGRPASAQSLRAYQVEMEARLAAIERRIETLEQDRSGRQAADQQAEADRQRDAITTLAATCRAFRNNPAAVQLFKDCAVKRQASKDVGAQCLSVQLDELTCH